MTTASSPDLLVWGKRGNINPSARAYAKLPDAFCTDVLGVRLWRGFEEMLWSVHAHRNTTIRGCYGSGKTFTLACALLWFLFTHEDSRVVTTAPTFRQVRDLIWAEIRRVWADSPKKSGVSLGGRCLQERLEINEKWFAVGFTASQYNESALQGYHAPQVLFMIDEGTGVSPAVFDAKDRLIIGPDDRFVTAGNPVDPICRFAETHRSALFNKIKISAFDTPNVKSGKVLIPGMVTQEWVEEKRIQWGEFSDTWKCRVMADFPENVETKLIPLSWVERSFELWHERERQIKDESRQRAGVKSVGVDIAHGGPDMTVYAPRQGTHGEPYIERRTKDLVLVANECEAFSERGYFPVLDANGIGAGVYDILRDRRVSCLGVVSSTTSGARDESGLLGFSNTRAEMHWNLRRRLNPVEPEEERLSLAPHDLLLADLTTPEYHYATGGRIEIESKDKVKAKLGRSPDHGDAVCLAYYREPERGAPPVSTPAGSSRHLALHGNYKHRKIGYRP